MKIFIAEGYLEDTPKPNKIKRLFICEKEEDTISKTNISNHLNKNFTISLDRLEFLIDSEDTYNEIYLVGEVFSTINIETCEDLKELCFELWTIDEEDYTIEEILKY